jgi:coenzyme PQQ precursor peptide PqqA
MPRIGRRLIYNDPAVGLNRSGSIVARSGRTLSIQEDTMAWTTPTLVEICIGLEINGYLPAEF